MTPMKYTVVTTLLALFLLVAGTRSASATEVGYGRKIGLGFILGDPTGLSGKYWVGPTNAFDFALGFTNYGAGVGAACFRDNNGVEHCQGYFDTRRRKRMRRESMFNASHPCLASSFDALVR